MFGLLGVRVHFLNLVLRWLLAPLLFSGMAGWAQQAPIMAVNAAIGSPAAVTTDASGNVYFISSGNNRVFKVDRNGILTTVAGSSVAGYSGDGGLAASAELNGPAGLASDSAGNLYIADSGNGRVRRVSPSGIIATVAGNGNGGYSGDGGPAIDAGISPVGLAIDGSGNLCISASDSIMYDTVVRMVSMATGIITTAAGGCLPPACESFQNFGSSAMAIELYQGYAIADDQSGNLYVVENTANYGVSYVYEFSGGVFVTDFSGVLGPTSVAVDRAGNLYMVDGPPLLLNGDQGCQVDAVHLTGYVNPTYELKVVAGNGRCSYSGDGRPAVDAGISPAAIAFDVTGNLYIADSGNQRIRKVSSDSGIITTIAGTGGVAISAVVNGASFQPGVASNSWITIEGTDLSPVTDTWASTIVDGNLPTSLDGVSVSVSGQPAYIEYVSPNQINAVAPNVGTGTALVTVTSPSSTSSAVTAIAQVAQPAFFQWGSYAVATHQDYSLAVKNGTFSGLTTVPAAPGDVIILWGTGFGPTTPSAPVGVELPSGTTYYTADAVSVTVGDAAATVYGAAMAPGFAGLYQVAIQIPPSLGNGDYSVVATINGAQSPGGTLITVQQ